MDDLEKVWFREARHSEAITGTDANAVDRELWWVSLFASHLASLYQAEVKRPDEDGICCPRAVPERRRGPAGRAKHGWAAQEAGLGGSGADQSSEVGQPGGDQPAGQLRKAAAASKVTLGLVVLT